MYISIKYILFVNSQLAEFKSVKIYILIKAHVADFSTVEHFYEGDYGFYIF